MKPNGWLTCKFPNLVTSFPNIDHSLRDIIKLWGKDEKGIALLDEVDQILHPLQSELNFPIGPKYKLLMSPERYEFPLHLLNALLYFIDIEKDKHSDPQETKILQVTISFFVSSRHHYAPGAPIAQLGERTDWKSGGPVFDPRWEHFAKSPHAYYYTCDNNETPTATPTTTTFFFSSTV